MTEPTAGRKHAAPHPVIRLHYLPRALSYVCTMLMLVGVVADDGLHWSQILLVPYCLVFPHLAYFLAVRHGNDLATEYRVMRVDSLNGALAAAWLGFALFPATALLLIVTLNAIIVGGRRLVLSTLPWLAIGAVLGAALNGFEFAWQTGVWTSAAAALSLGIYALAVGFQTNTNAARLRALKRELTAKSVALEQASLTDPLTGARNRRYVSHLMETSSQMAGSRRVAFALVDVDHFKGINDRHGHAAGDAVLRELAARLAELCAGRHELVRWGGEEFLLIVVGVDPATLPAFADALHTAIVGRPFALPDGGALPVTVSTGLVTRRGGNAAALAAWQTDLGVADLALYRAKAAGRNQWLIVELDATAPVVGPAESIDSLVDAGVARVIGVARA